MSSNLKKPHPPRLGTWLLERFCSYDFLSTALWDLEELFGHNVRTKGTLRAKALYMLEVFGIITHLFLKGKSQYSTNKTAMFKHNIIISLRSFKRYKGSFSINLFGLATGLASALLVYLWVNDELNMNHFKEKDSHKHYQVFINNHSANRTETQEKITFPLPNALEQDFPEVEYTIPVILSQFYEGVVSHENQFFRADPQYVGDRYFDVFSCEFLAGEKASAWSDQNNVVISERMALGLFRDVDQAIGKTVFFKNKTHSGNYLVSGVFRPDSKASSKFDLLLTYDLFLSKRTDVMNWWNEGPLGHVVLSEGVELDQFNAKIKDYLKTKVESTQQTLFAQKFSDTYLYGVYENGHPTEGRIVYVRIFLLIALFVLIIACINYVNLSTAQATRRIKEIGVKKAVGAQRSTLIYQYIAESIFMTFLSLALAIVIIFLLLPQFNAITGKQLSIHLDPGLSIPILAITLLTGLISSIYPALYLSGFKPVLALKGKMGRNSGGRWLHKGLVIFQFAVSVVLIISVTVIYLQINFIQTSNLGYDNEHLISFDMEGKLVGNAEAFNTEAKKIAGVVNASHLWGTLPGKVSWRSNLQWKDQDPELKSTAFHYIDGGHEMAKLLDVEIKEGRFLSEDIPSDKASIVMNETAIALIGYKDPIGQKFYTGREMCTIVGVVKDFHFEGLHEEIKPFFFKLGSKGNTIMVKIASENQSETLGKLRDLYHDFNPGYPFEFTFVDDNYQKLYIEEERISTLSKYLSAIAITISCLGLLALTAFSTQRRFKEVAIRKVLGSSSVNIMRLLSKEFILLVLLAILIAAPIGFYLMQSWLDGFAYRIELQPIYLALSCLFMLAIAWLTIMSQVVNSTKVNVTESLRTEG